MTGIDDPIDAKRLQELRERLKLPEPLGDPKIVITTTPSPNEHLWMTYSEFKAAWIEKRFRNKIKKSPPISKFNRILDRYDKENILEECRNQGKRRTSTGR